MVDLKSYLGRHDFKTLFIEELGWDHASTQHHIEANDERFTINVLAHKRGFQILHCHADRFTLFNRRKLRTLERQVAKVAHEHIVIFTCSDPDKQVWQWAVHMPDGRKVRHREHAFFSSSPPAGLLSRLAGLRFSLEHEEQATIVDAIARAKAVLDVEPERNNFVNRPVLAKRGDELARAMAVGGVAAFHEFVLFHRALASWGTRRLVKRFGMDQEDAAQFGMVALIDAANGFDPGRGFQFSTYATTVIHKRCTREGPAAALLIRVPHHVVWWCDRVALLARKLAERHGPEKRLHFLAWMADRSPQFRQCWVHYEQAMSLTRMSDIERGEYVEFRSRTQGSVAPSQRLEDRAVAQLLRECIDTLSDKEQFIIKSRFGLDGPAQTLTSIGDGLGLTKERIRQVELQSLDKLRSAMTGRIERRQEIPDDEPDAEECAQKPVGARRQQHITGRCAHWPVAAPRAKPWSSRPPAEWFPPDIALKNGICNASQRALGQDLFTHSPDCIGPPTHAD